MPPTMITRCPACQTAFKVVPDQLRIAAGWVRCGHCGELFDGQAHLLGEAPQDELEPQSVIGPADRELQSEIQTPAESPASDQLPVTIDPVELEVESNTEVTDVQIDRPLGTDTPIHADRTDVEDTTIPPVPGEPTFEEIRFQADARDQPRFVRSSLDPEPSFTASDSLPPEFDISPRVPPSITPAPRPPSFVSRSRGDSFWNKAPARAALWAVLFILLVTLALQWGLYRRDWLAARFPTTTPAMKALCLPFGCRVSPYRMLDAIAIDGSDLKAIDAHTFRFDLSLRNHARLAVATPALELTLTDGEGRVLVRRVIGPGELGAPATLKAQSEFDTTRAIRVANPVNPGAIANYRIVAFYP